MSILAEISRYADKKIGKAVQGDWGAYDPAINIKDFLDKDFSSILDEAQGLFDRGPTREEEFAAAGKCAVDAFFTLYDRIYAPDVTKRFKGLKEHLKFIKAFKNKFPVDDVLWQGFAPWLNDRFLQLVDTNVEYAAEFLGGAIARLSTAYFQTTDDLGRKVIGEYYRTLAPTFQKVVRGLKSHPPYPSSYEVFASVLRDNAMTSATGMPDGRDQFDYYERVVLGTYLRLDRATAMEFAAKGLDKEQRQRLGAWRPPYRLGRKLLRRPRP